MKNVTIFYRTDLVNIDERKQQEALRVFYEKQSKLKQMNKLKKRIQRLKKFSLVINPIICVMFVALFWVLGINHYYMEV